MFCFNPKYQLVMFYSNIVQVADLSPDPKRLTDLQIPCDFIILSVNNTDNDPGDPFVPFSAVTGYAESAQQIYWGVDNNPVHQVFPVQYVPFLIPISNARDIFIRTDKKKAPDSGTSLSFSCLKWELRTTFPPTDETGIR